MIHKQELTDAIAEMHGERNPDANTCLKLAAYYIIQDHMYPEPGADHPEDKEMRPPAPADLRQDGYSHAGRPGGVVAAMGDTEFFQAIGGKPVPDVLAVMDDLMTALKQTYPRLYAATIRRLSE